MGVTVIHNTTQKAKKKYHDDGWEEISEWISGGCCVGIYRNPQKITFAEARLVVKYRNNREAGWTIATNDLYVRQFNSYDGDTYVWRTKKEFYDLICKYDLFTDI